MKKAVIFCLIVIFVLEVHNSYLIKISRLEKGIIKQKKINEDLAKVLLKTQNHYTKVADLKKLEIEMRNRRNMEISKEVRYFKIKEDMNGEI